MNLKSVYRELVLKLFLNAPCLNNCGIYRKIFLPCAIKKCRWQVMMCGRDEMAPLIANAVGGALLFQSDLIDLFWTDNQHNDG
jgi:hypothetical protein